MKSSRVLIPGLLALAVSVAVHADSAQIKGFPPQVQAADLVLLDANIATLDPLVPKAQALAIRDKKILALGSDGAIRHYVGKQTKVLDLHGAFVTPGFIEDHGHLMDTGESLMQVDVGKAANWDEVVAVVKAAVAKAKPGEWIVGQGWQQAKWNKVPQPNVDGLPLPAALDAVSPNNPVLLNHASGHGIIANALALKLAGIGDKTPDPAGGLILRDAQGHATGMLRDNAANAVFAAYDRYLKTLPPAEQAAHRERALQLSVQNEISKGITTIVDQGESFAMVDWLKQQAGKGLPLRLYVYIDETSPAELDQHLAEHRTIGYADDHFTVRGIGEDVSDGALGTHSAWFLEPYSDAPTLTGLNVTKMSDLNQIARIAARDGFQVAIHAIGDRANRELLDMYQQIFTEDPAARALRWRIEHAQHLAPSDIPRFAELGVIASMQSIHMCSDAPMVVSRIGEKRAEEGAYVWKKLIDSGAIVLDGTDTPVEDTNPIPNFYCGVTRAYDHGRKTLFPGQAKTRLQELQSYTWNNAYAIYQENQLGSLSPGKLADITVFSGDLLTVPAADILRTRVLYTIIGGKVVYQRPGADKWQGGQSFEAMPEFDHAE
ncbi:amidohydrolase [Rhodanobacter sp. DHG33]|uniref:amidohydrolase n=1 Tax=Rhodanobacter sp. DHG33 TaxID=2775921 RepID=UPI00177CF450|nr:amidohydrolase [Rhodanobacter sp. DHG33]MBD8898458.1 amidohydrolase [Rhodanobacter sp. DHG33]